MTKHYQLPKAALLLCLLGCLLPMAALAEANTAAQWLERMTKAAQTLTYEGVFVYRHQGALEAMRIIHRADGGSVNERLYSLTGTAREIVRDNEKVICILPDSRSVLVDRRSVSNPLSQLVPRDVDSLSRSYHLEVVGSGRVADRDAVKIGISPRDQYRFGYRLWIDQELGLLLQADVFDESGKQVEQLMFTELRTPATITDAILAPQMSTDGYTWYREEPLLDAKNLSSTWEYNDLPQGFELVTHDMRRVPGSDGPVEHLMFSDGLANVSVYIEKAASGEAFEGHSAMGAVRAYGRVLNGATQLTVVGEVPAVTVERIGKGIDAAD